MKSIVLPPEYAPHRGIARYGDGCFHERKIVYGHFTPRDDICIRRSDIACYFEKYDLKLPDEFIEHVMKQTAAKKADLKRGLLFCYPKKHKITGRRHGGRGGRVCGERGATKGTIPLSLAPGRIRSAGNRCCLWDGALRNGNRDIP